jgi:two-component system chemotaxis response regulator CheB
MNSASPIRVLVVDDSALARKIIVSSLAPFADIKVIDTAVDPYDARDKILKLCPDVVTLDIEMPKMDGITFLKLIMKHKPRPVIIMSSLSGPGTEKAFEALQNGAVDVMGKPSDSMPAHADGALLAHKIRAAAHARLEALAPMPSNIVPMPGVNRRPASFAAPPHPQSLILLGASTGGTEALKNVLMSMTGNLPCICIVQHIPGYFSRAFAERLNQLCAMEVREAVDGEPTKPGLALIAPGGYHMWLSRRPSGYTVHLDQSAPVHHQRPAVDVLFESAVREGAAPHSAAALLTGMGSDGAYGLRRLYSAGAFTIAQDERTSVVFGMPRKAIELGAARVVLPLNLIGPTLNETALNGAEARTPRTVLAEAQPFYL